MGVAVALAVRLVGPRPWRGALGSLMAAVAVGWAVATAVPAGPWLAAAVVRGSLTHLLGNAITSEGVPLLWPLRRRLALPVLRSGGLGETVVTVVCSTLVVWRTYQLLEPIVRTAG